jgi:hypothetical protein
VTELTGLFVIKNLICQPLLSFLFLDFLVDTYSGVSKELTATIFRVNELFQVDVKVIQIEKCVSDFGCFDAFGP